MVLRTSNIGFPGGVKTVPCILMLCTIFQVLQNLVCRTQVYCIGRFREVLPPRSARDEKLMLAFGGGSYLDRNPNLRTRKHNRLGTFPQFHAIRNRRVRHNVMQLFKRNENGRDLCSAVKVFPSRYRRARRVTQLRIERDICSG
jgi:hypothetical protein